jgi:hypothetical protein
MSTIASAVPADILACYAQKYIWWKTPDEAVRFPRRVIAQVMDIGDYDDVLLLHAAIGDRALIDALAHAEVGQFSPRSWTYWHYRLGLAAVDAVPPMPQRRFE